jgi:hypothetical protein
MGSMPGCQPKTLPPSPLPCRKGFAPAAAPPTRSHTITNRLLAPVALPIYFAIYVSVYIVGVYCRELLDGPHNQYPGVKFARVWPCCLKRFGVASPLV